jgi:hypothetical protein
VPSFPAGIWAADWEFSREEDQELPRPVCFAALEVGSGREIRLFGEKIYRYKEAPLPTGPDACMLAYSSGAEGSCFAVAGWQDPVNIIDPYAEHLVELNGRPGRYEGDTQLLEAMRHHGLPVREHAHKTAMRDLARFKDPRAMTAEERTALSVYNMEDNFDTRDLYHTQVEKGLIDVPQALWRGRYVYLNGSMIQHEGLPTDTAAYEEIGMALPRFRPAILNAVDEYGIFEDGHLREAKVNVLIEQAGLAEVWPLTETGKYKRDEKTWKEMATLHDSGLTDPRARRLMPLYRAFSLLEQLEDPGFTIGSDKRNRYWTRPLLSKTGRNQPGKGNILAAHKVWRGLLTGIPGYALVEIDYSSQEIWIRAGRSGCPVSLEELASGDPHLMGAINTNFVAADASPEVLAVARERIKPLTHGISYGISHVGISKQLGVPTRRAISLRRSYDRTHPDLIAWQNAYVRHAYSTRRITAPMGWSMYVDQHVSRRTLLNWPMQTIGGEILRAAVVMLAAQGFTICATAHDSIYFLMPLDNLAEQIALAKEIMSLVTLPFTNGYPIPTKYKIVLPGERLLTPETRPIWDWLITLARTPKGQEWTALRTPDTCITSEHPPV